MPSQQSTSLTVATVDARARSDYNDTDYFSPSEILEFINDGVSDIESRTHCVHGKELITITNGKIDTGKLSSKYIKIKSVTIRVTDSGGFPYVFPVTLGGQNYAVKNGSPKTVSLNAEEDDTDYPVFWFDFASHIYIYPPTIGTAYLLDADGNQLLGADGNTLLVNSTIPATVHFSKLLDDSVSTVYLPAIFDNTLLLYVLCRMALKDKNIALYNALSKTYQETLTGYKESLKNG